jgi:hypothetical protein
MKILMQMIPAAVLLILLGGFLLLGGIARPYAPQQPIAYDHGIHVTKQEGPQLECTFCHENADKSSHATIPNISTCMACHESIKTDSPEVQKLAAYSQRGEQPPWARVYWIPKSANAFFTHKPHIKANVDCVTCHGQVGQMHQVKREVNQDMGWCVDCHRTQHVSIDCYICHR